MSDFGVREIAAAYVDDSRIDRSRQGSPRRQGRDRGRRSPPAPQREPARADRGRHRTGKTRTLQLLAEQLSARAPVFAADMKGDLSGIARRVRPSGPAAQRAGESARIGAPGSGRVPRSADRPGVPVRATVSEFGPLLLRKVLGLNETQEPSLGARLPLRRRKGLPLLDLGGPPRGAHLPDRTGQGGAQGARRDLAGDGRGAAARLVALGGRRRHEFFGEPEFDVTTSCAPRPTAAASSCSSSRTCRTSRRCSRRPDVAAGRAVRAAPRGRRPRQAEARVLLRRGPPAVRRRHARPSSSRSTQTVRLIRSKGVGVFFITQPPKDIPTTSSPSSETACSTPCARSRSTTRRPSARPCARSRSPNYDLEELLRSSGSAKLR